MEPVERIVPQPWMTEPATRTVLAVLGAGGGQPRFVGGCVRDALLGRPIADIDIATSDPPETVLALLAAAAIKAVPTGLAHGTVTAVLPGRHFEITTLRHDIETFGRHARVAFTDNWAADAARRDFTMNALFLDGEGRIYDPVGGLPDLRAGHVRFVGDPERRIREDVLRLLRFYRFHAHYGKGAADRPARAACRALAPLLPGLSGERVQAELLKLLGAPDPAAVWALMVEDGVAAVLLPEAAANGRRLAALVPLEPAPDPLRRLAALLPDDAAAAGAVATRLRLSNPQRRRLALLAEPPWPVDLEADERAQRRALYHLGLAAYCDLLLLRGAATGEGSRARALLAAAPQRVPPGFPLQGRDAVARGVSAGPRVGALIAAVEAWWEEGGFAADRAACLDHLEELIRADGGR